MTPRLLVAGFLALALAGCASAPTPPVTRSELSDIVTSLRDIAWKQVAYNDGERPPLVGGATLADAAWSAEALRCFSDAGYRVQQVDDGQFAYQTGIDHDYRRFALTSFACENAHPRLSQLAEVIDDDAFARLTAYIDNTVEPCLSLSGHPVDTGEGVTLDPFAMLELPTNEQALLERRCPPVPSWLTLE